MKFVCQVCGYVHEGDTAPEKCPQCNAPAEKFTQQSEDRTWAAEHVVGVAQGVSEDILADLRANFNGGGEGKTGIGRPGPCTPWGKPALGLKTRKKNISVM